LTLRALTLAVCLAAGAAGLADAASNASTAADAQAELKQLRGRIEAIQRRLAQAEESKAEAADALQTSERAISDANRAIADLTEQSRSANARVAELRREIEKTQREVKRQREAAAQLVYRQYTAGRPDTLAILLSGRDPNAIARDLQYLTYIGRARSELVNGLATSLARQNALLEEADAKAAELATVTAEQTRQRRRLEDEKRTRALVLTRISREIEQQRREIGTLKRDEARLARLIDQLSRLMARKPRPKQPAESHARSEPELQNERLPEAEHDEGPFARLKGRLALPVRGELANRFGSPRQGGGVVWKGLFIAARAGEEVRAIAGGRVVFADWLRGFGNLLIVDHGENYMSLYGYNETLYKRVGDLIRGGERIAAVGNTGGHRDSGLYFEIRHEGRPFDPMTWVSREARRRD
jgi:septal ring factor EnvC (AmiA/AmiB activator)